MLIVYERILGLAQEREISLGKFCDDIGISKNTITNWKTRDPKPEKLIAAAKYFGVSTDYLYGLTDSRGVSSPSKGLTSEQLKLVHFIEDAYLTDKQCKIVLKTIQGMMEYNHL